MYFKKQAVTNILILRHRKLDVFLNKSILKKIINPHAEATSTPIDVIAPEDFYGSDFKSEDTVIHLEKIISNIDTLSLCFFEANLGRPGDLNANTEALSLLASKFPQTVFVLKSHTADAIEDAQRHLMEHHAVPESNIIKQAGKDVLTDQISKTIVAITSSASDDNTPSL